MEFHAGRRHHIEPSTLIQHKLTLMRAEGPQHQQLPPPAERDRDADGLRGHARHADAADRDRDPLETMKAPVIDGKKTVFVPIHHAYAVPASSTACSKIGARRGSALSPAAIPRTLVAVEYYFRCPRTCRARRGRARPCSPPATRPVGGLTGSGDPIREVDPFRLPAPRRPRPGQLPPATPTCRSTPAAIDRELNEHGYILPGLGDAGDRLFGTDAASGQRGGDGQPLPAITNRCQMKRPKRSGCRIRRRPCRRGRPRRRPAAEASAEACRAPGDVRQRGQRRAPAEQQAQAGGQAPLREPAHQLERGTGTAPAASSAQVRCRPSLDPAGHRAEREGRGAADDRGDRRMVHLRAPTVRRRAAARGRWPRPGTPAPS